MRQNFLNPTVIDNSSEMCTRLLVYGGNNHSIITIFANYLGYMMVEIHTKTPYIKTEIINFVQKSFQNEYKLHCYIEFWNMYSYS